MIFDKEQAHSDLRMLTTSVDKRDKDYVEKKGKPSKMLCVLMKRYRGPPVTRLCGDNKNLDEVNTRNESGGKVFQRKAKRSRAMTRGMKKKIDEGFVDDEEGRRRKVKKDKVILIRIIGKVVTLEIRQIKKSVLRLRKLQKLKNN